MQNQRAISRAIIKAEENERNRLAAELHDNVNQLLVSARLYIGIERKKQGNEGEHLLKADEYLNMAIEEIRELSRKLTSTMITTEGLERSIEEIAASMFMMKDIKLHVNISTAAVEKLSGEQQLMIYRIIQEQTCNILKHAETKAAVISLLEKDKNVELVISDNGKGFDKTEQKLNGIGFINIFNRVNAFNGKMEVISSPGKGCKLIVIIPVSEAEEI